MSSSGARAGAGALPDIVVLVDDNTPDEALVVQSPNLAAGV